jgi:single-stranded DNA-binding protein
MVTGRLRQRSWETPEGDKRSVTEIEADEVGASLKWATAKVERASERATSDRTKGGSGQPNAAATSTNRHPSEHRSTLPAPPLGGGAGFRDTTWRVATTNRSALRNVQASWLLSIVVPRA